MKRVRALRWLPLWYGLLCLLPSGASLALDMNAARAKFNYQMFCQGCHTPSGEGHNSVPQIKGHIGLFLASQTGREYLVRVPGAANSVLDDPQLAELLNWMIVAFAEHSIPDDWQPYTDEEVASYRQAPLYEVVNYRKQLLQQLMETP